ncbi:MAG: glycoside hydrolase family 3 N-terminal domain-containing protein [Desulfocapsaceae bacterium]|nr:glycoside hydrolase family 3 N-terminal domain-containing protein [Desulfocapsaceae bacterium]
MDLEKKIGQLFLLGFHGEALSENHSIASDIRERNLGGVILFDRFLAENLSSNNILTASQVRRLTTDLQRLAGGRLLIGVDQEGGKVCRFAQKRGFPASISAAQLGEKDDAVLTEIHALATADMLQCLGVNFNLAPVVDLNVHQDNPIIGRVERSFSFNADTVIRHAKAWITAHRQRRILTCLKHFPGHGSSRHDSHQGFVDISETWSQEELLPFAELIRRGLADAIMTGHLFNRHLDPDYPATLSPRTITDILRKKLGFAGIILTDDLQMKAITDRYGLEEAVCMALAAGADMVVIGNNLAHDPDILDKAIRAVARGIRTGTLPEEMVAAACRRVQTLKTAMH